jgi:hypothetical protein
MRWIRIIAGLSALLGLYWFVFAKRNGGLIGVGFAFILIALTPAGYGIVENKYRRFLFCVVGCILIVAGIAFDDGVRESLFWSEEPPEPPPGLVFRS